MPAESRCVKTPERADPCQLFLEVTAKKESSCCATFTLLHLGQRAFFFSYSLTLMSSENFFPHFLQMYPYVGISISSDACLRSWSDPIMALFFADDKEAAVRALREKRFYEGLGR
jgi:hypothetical protein